MLSRSSPLHRRWPLLGLAALLLLIALAALLTGPGTARAHGPHGEYNLGHVHLTDQGGGNDGAPHAPTGFAQPTFTDGEIEVHWTPATTGPAGVNWLVGHRKVGGSSMSEGHFNVLSNERSYTITGLDPGVAYTVFVRRTSPSGFGDRAEAHNVVAGVVGAPAFMYAQDEGTKLTVTFNQNLDAASAPAGSAFTVTIAAPGGPARTIAGTGTAVLSGRTATVTLASAVAHAYNEKVTLSYTKPASGPLQDTSGNETANFSGKQLTDFANLGHAHFTAGTAGCTTCPDMPAGYAEPGFGDGLIEVHWTPAATGTAALFWTIAHRKSGTTEYTQDEFSLPPSTRSYTYSGLEPGVRYDILLSGRTTGIGDRAYAANVAAGVQDGPNFASATVNGNLLTVTFDRALNEDSVPANDRFEVRTRHGGGEGIPRCQGECLVPVTGVSITGKTVTLTLAKAIPSHGRTNLKYTRPPSSTSNNAARLIGEAIGYPAAPFHEQVTHAADTDAPLFSSAQLFPYRSDDCDWRHRPGVGQRWTCLLTYDEKAFLELLFTEVLDKDAKPPASAFRVTATPPGRGARTVAVTRVANISGSQVRLETGPVPGGKDARIAVSYVKPSTAGLRDRAGNLLESFSGQPVTNGFPMIESIRLVSDPGPDRTYGLGEQVRVEVTFDTAVEVYGSGGRPRLKLDLTPESGGQRWAYWDGQDETDTLTFTYTVAGTDVSTAGILVPRNPVDGNGSRIGSFHAWPRLDADLSFSWLAHNPAHKVDSSLPGFQSAAADWKTLTMTFTANLDAASKPAPGAFRVTANGARRNVANGGVAVSGKTVTLTLASPVDHGDTVRVRYTRPSAMPLRGAGGIAVATLSDQAVTNNTPAGVIIWSAALSVKDFAPSVFRGCLDLSTGNECTGALTPNSFGDAQDPTRVVGFGVYINEGTGRLELMLDKEISGEWTLHVDDRQFPVADATLSNSSKTASWANSGIGIWPQNQQVKLRLTAPVPAFKSAVVDEKTLTMTFTENLDAASKPAPGVFRVTVNNARRNVASGGVAVSGKTVTLTLASPVARTDTVRVRYTRPSAMPLRGAGGIAVATLSDQAVTNNTPAGVIIWSAALSVKDFAPSVFRGCLDLSTGNECTGALTPNSFGDAQDPTRVVGFGVYINEGTGRLELMLDKEISGEWTLHVDDRQFPVADATLSNSSKTASWANSGIGIWPQNQQVKLRLTAPVPAFKSAVVDEKTLTMTFTENLDAASKPAPGVFRVTVNNARRNVASGGVAVSGKTVTLTLASPVARTDTVRVRYTRPSAMPLRGAGGIAVATLSDQAVTNNTPAGVIIWSAALSVKDFAPSVFRGCLDLSTGNECTGALTPNSFGDAQDPTRVVGFGVYINEGTGRLELMLDKEISGEWTLHVDDRQFPVADATLSNSSKTASWANSGIGIWPQNQQVKLRLTKPTDTSIDSAPATAQQQQQVPAASVTGVSVVSDPGADQTYGIGDTIQVQVAFNQLVVDVDTSGGTPRIKIDMDPAEWGEKWASYASGSGSANLIFTHTVVEPNISPQGIAVLANSLELNGGTIQSDGADADLAHTGLGHDANHKVDWQAASDTSGAVESDPPAESSNLLGQGQANSPAAGAPSITGTARVGEILTADTSAISDSDGLSGVTFAYQWLADDADISGAAGNSYTLASTDLGKAVKVRVSFTDDAGYKETLTSAATAAVAAKPPDVTGVRITSDAGDDDTYAKDDVIRISLTFDEKVDVDTSDGTPRLTIKMDPDYGEKLASYASGSGTASLVFTHTVVEPNISTQGIAVLANSLDLNGGTIKSSATQADADLSHTGLAHDANHKVDWETQPDSSAGGDEGGASGDSGDDSSDEQSAPATVTAVNVSSSPRANATYRAGETISVTLTFSEAVTVDTTGGTPTLNIDMDPADWGTKAASYASGSGTATLTFTHTVVEPNISRQGIAVLEDSLALNGGTIQANGVAATLSHDGRKHDANHKVDWRPQAPEVDEVEVTSDAGDDDTYALGDVIRITVTFDEAVDVDTTGGAPRLKIDMDPADWGEKWATYEGGSGTATLTFVHTVVEPNISTQGIAVLENSLTLNGGDIESSASDTDADLSHTGLGHDPEHKVDWEQSDSGGAGS